MTKISLILSVIFFSLVVSLPQTSLAQGSADKMLPDLPQKPVLNKLRSDAQDEGLKGKIRKVVVEREDTRNSSIKTRQMSSVSYFNDDGNFVRRDYYDWAGNLFQVTKYGYIDGKRVSNSKTIRHEYDPPPMAAPKPSPNTPDLPRDERYQYSYIYKYVDGKLAEKQLILNNGKLGLRYVYSRVDDHMEWLVYTPEGELNQKRLIIFDKNQNEIEETIFGLKNRDIYGDPKYRYVYEFDKKRNWIKKTASREITENGVTSFKPEYIHYRTVTYF